MHAEVVSEELLVCLTVRFNVAILSHPTELVRVAVYVPAVEYDVPLNK